jgi:hypothetical protein
VKEGFIKPQMVAYLPDLNRIVVSNEGDGSCKILDANTYQLIDTVKFSDDADQLRYDPAAKRVYVGYGDEAIGVFDATTNKKIGGDFEVAPTRSLSNSRRKDRGSSLTQHLRTSSLRPGSIYAGCCARKRRALV